GSRFVSLALQLNLKHAPKVVVVLNNQDSTRIHRLPLRLQWYHQWPKRSSVSNNTETQAPPALKRNLLLPCFVSQGITSKSPGSWAPDGQAYSGRRSNNKCFSHSAPSMPLTLPNCLLIKVQQASSTTSVRRSLF